MRKAFIAAPLIGTIIFVTAIVFVVNINKSENNAITQISQEAYHNRINSIVELYRSDAGSLFREDVKKVIEQALTSQCWSQFKAEVPNQPGDPPATKAAHLREARYNSCHEIKETIQTVICANTGDSGDANCINNQCGSLSGQAQAHSRCVATSTCRASRSYGLQNFFDNINQDFEFEGMTLSPANKEKFEAFFKPRRADGDTDLFQYITNCRDLMKELTIDCSAFAGTANEEPKLQCCSKDVAIGETCESTGGSVIPGCESGIFYVKVVTSQDNIFAALPRIQAKDGAGNYLRAGAISESEELLLPITFPLLKYLNASFSAYQYLAYGPTIGYDDGEQEGVLDGVCHGSDAFCTAGILPVTGFAFPFSSGSTRSTTGREDARGQLVERYYLNNVLGAFSTFSPELQVQVLDGLENPAGQPCRRAAGGPMQCDQASETELKNAIRQGSDAGQVEVGTSFIWYPYLGDTRLKYKIVDADPSFRVRKDKPNEFCTSAILKYTS